MALSENEMSENANVGDTFEFCDKGKKRNREVVGGRCESRRFFFLMRILHHILLMDGSSFAIGNQAKNMGLYR